MAIGNLSEDLLMEILCWLPVKSLLQFKSVCKKWYALILNPNFVSLHHRRAAAKKADCLLVKRFLNDGWQGGVTLSFVPNETPVEDIDISSTDLAIDISSASAIKHLQILGPCNGVVCLTRYGSSSPIVLCNPSVKEFRLLPVQSYTKKKHMRNLVFGFDPQTEHMCNLGFGFDSHKNDYKVVRFAMTSSDLPIRGVELYDLSTDSWRKVDTKSPVVSGFTCHLQSSSYTSWNGDFFWYANPEHGGAPVITSFSMSDEAFEEWPVPEICLLDQHSEKKLLPLGNSLAMAIYPKWSLDTSVFPESSLEKSFDIWVMNEADVEVSWTKKFTIGPLQGLEWALGFRQNGEFLLENDYGQVMSYNLHTQERKAYQVYGSWPPPPNVQALLYSYGGRPRPPYVQALVYTESLVSVKRHN